jgi:hypothetical protein
LIFSHAYDGPDLYGASSFFETMPSRPSLQTALNISLPSPSVCSVSTMRRLNAKGRGIILMHDIHRATAMALPILLKELKANGYNVVHVVAAGERPKSIPELMALPGSDEKAPPTELSKASSGDDAVTARQTHRIKKRRVSRHHPAHWWFQADQVTTTKRPFWVFSGY